MGGLAKLIAKNHQFLGVNNMAPCRRCATSKTTRESSVYSGTPKGSGKSYSMVTFSCKVLRKMPGNWTFVIVTDQDDLDKQIYGNFANTWGVAGTGKPLDEVRADGARKSQADVEPRQRSSVRFHPD